MRNAGALRRVVSALVVGVLCLGGVATSTVAASAAEPGTPADHPVVMYLAVGQGYTGLTQAELETQARDQFATMAKYWLEQSRGLVDFRLESVTWNPTPVSCGARGDAQSARQAEGQAAVGFQTAPRRHFLYAVVAGCSFLGNGTAGQSLNDSNRNVYLEQSRPENGMWVHEFGHNLSLGHASTLYCPDNAVDCDSTAEGGPGTFPTYSDGTDTMASSYSTVLKGLSTPNAVRLGFLGDTGYINVEGDTTRTVTIESRDILDQDGQPRSVRITDPISNRTFYIEMASRDTYNAPIWWGGRPADIETVNGDQYQFDFGVRVLRFQAPEGATYQNTFLLPAPRNADGIRRTVWDQGATFTSASGGTTVEVAAVTRTTATLNIRTRADIVPPDAPTALESNGSEVTGVAEPGATITVFDASGATIGSGVSDPTTGAFTVALSPTQADGAVVDTVATDAAGNTSEIGQVVVQLPTASAPDAPTQLTSDGVVVKGIAEPGSTVSVTTAAGDEIGDATADAQTGAFTVTLTTPQLDGASLSVTATNTSGTSPLATVSVVAPPVSIPTPPDNLSSDGTTVSGTAEPGRDIIVADSSGAQIGTGVADSATGTFRIGLNPQQNNGAVLTVIARAASGAESQPTRVTVSVTPPTAPDAPTQVSSDGATVSGRAQGGTTIQVTAPNGEVIGTGVTAEDGRFTVRLTAVQDRGAALSVIAVGQDGIRSVATIVVVVTPLPPEVDNPGTSPVAPESSSSGAQSSGKDGLAATGLDALPGISIALLLLIGGVMTLIVSRRAVNEGPTS